MTIGEKIKKIRRIKEITQKELGKQIGFSESQISHLEHNNRKLSLEQLQKIANFLDIPYEYFLKEQNFTKNITHQTTENELIIKDFKKFALKKIYENK